MSVVTNNLVLEYVGRLATGTAEGTNDPQVTTFTDLANSNDGALSGFSYIATDGWDGDGSSDSPYRLVSDKTGGYVTITDAADLYAANFSVELWMTLITTSASNQIVFDNRHDASTANGSWYVYVGAGTTNPTLGYRDGTPATRYIGLTGCDFTDGVHHALWTCDGTNVCAYFDGALFKSHAQGFTPRVDSVNPTLFVATNGSGYPGNVAIATFRIYKDALSEAEVLTNYNYGPLAASTDTETVITQSSTLTIEQATSALVATVGSGATLGPLIASASHTIQTYATDHSRRAPCNADEVIDHRTLTVADADTVI